MSVDLDDFDDWVKVGRRGPEQGGRPPRFTSSKLFTTKNARRGGGGFKVHVPEGAPRFVLGMGYTQRAGIGADSRNDYRRKLMSQAGYNGRDGVLGFSYSFDAEGRVDDVRERVAGWEDDKRYFRASLNPLEHDRIKDWPEFTNDFMAAFQHGSHRAFGMEGQAMHWHSDGLLTDEDRAKGIELDWTGSIHRETGRTHVHLLIRGKVGMDDLYIEPGATKELWKVGHGVVSMDQHVGLQLQQSPELERAAEQAIETIQKQMQMEDRAVRQFMELDL